MSNSTPRHVDWKIKLAAFLHDPPHKPVVLENRHKDKVGHEKIALRLLQGLGLGIDSLQKPRWAKADYIASTADRVPTYEFRNYKKMIEVKFQDQGAMITHPFAQTPPLDRLKLPTYLQLANLPTASADWEQQWAQASDELHEPLQELYRDEDTHWLAYLLIWQYFPDRLGTAWKHLPADTRIPDHSIWLHNGVVSGLAGAAGETMDKNKKPRLSFLRVNLPGVQTFLSQARRMHDLWSGSYIVARIMWAGIQALVRTLGPDALLFPSLRDHPYLRQWMQEEITKTTGFTPYEASESQASMLRVSAVPNSLLAMVPAGREQEYAEAVVQAMKEEWETLGQEVFSLLDLSDLQGEEHTVIQDAFKAQTQALLHPVWVAYEWLDYGKANDEVRKVKSMLDQWLPEEVAEEFDQRMKVFEAIFNRVSNQGVLYSVLHDLGIRLIQDRKAVQTSASSPEEEGEKCTICGIRNALYTKRPNQIRNWGDYRQGVQSFWKQLTPKIHAITNSRRLREDGKERLCAVCTVKRLVSDTDWLKRKVGKSEGWHSFPSTSTLAALSWKRRVVEYLVGHQDTPDSEELWKHMNLYLTDTRKFLSPAYGTETENLKTLYPAGLPWQERGLAASRVAELERFMRLDGEWLFVDELYRAEEDAPSPAHEAVQALQDLLNTTHRLGLGAPTKYFALLRMDGDDVGKLIAGDKNELPTWENVLHRDCQSSADKNGLSGFGDLLPLKRAVSPSVHMTISQALSGFATETAPEVVSRHGGFLIYAGGDDLLALFPADQVMEAAQELHSFYTAPFVAIQQGETAASILQAPSIDMKQLKQLRAHMGASARISASIVFAHHHVPLKPLLHESTRLLEQVAKLEPGKNSCALTVYHRNGQKVENVHSWEELDSLQQAVNALSAEEVSSRFLFQAQEFERLLASLTDEEREDVLLSLLLKSRAIQHDEQKVTRSDDRKLQARNTIRHLLKLANWEKSDSDRMLASWMLARFLSNMSNEEGGLSHEG
ncbi:MAG TPA: type III-B CRISPR-associated protein Cas10/Cmr2 [Bacilli bacterium]|nr:type III-B CRISPR-associated protein Cas10/Cmr2 [Bacilli bacterium]